jgi:hypothetical protein
MPIGVAGAGTVLDDDRLAELRRELIQHGAPGQIGCAAGGQRHDRADGFRRPFLSKCTRRQRREQDHRQDAAQSRHDCGDRLHDSSRGLFERLFKAG